MREKNKMAMIHHHTIFDQFWGTTNYNGLKRVRDELGWEIRYAHNLYPQEDEESLRDFAENNFDVIMAGGLEHADATIKVARDYSDVKFMIVDLRELKVTLPNLGGITGNWPESGYLSGIVAGGMTKTNLIGIAAGFDAPWSVRSPLAEAFKSGVKSQNPKVEFVTEVAKGVGKPRGDSHDPQTAYDAAVRLVDAGVDIVFNNVIDEGAYGLVDALRERGKGRVYLIGGHEDEFWLAPEITLTSAVRNIPQLYVYTAKLFEEGKLEAKLYRLGLKEGATGIAPYHMLDEIIPSEVKKKVEKAKQDIIGGRIKVPTK